MAHFFIEYHSGSPKKFGDLKELNLGLSSDAKTLCAEGEDLPFEDLIRSNVNEIRFKDYKKSTLVFDNTTLRTERISWSFINCTFNQIVFKETTHKDLIFENCTINALDFNGVQLKNLIHFKSCTIIKAKFNVCNLEAFKAEALQNTNFQFINCRSLGKITINNCDYGFFRFYKSSLFGKIKIDIVNGGDFLFDTCDCFDNIFFELTNSNSDFTFLKIRSKTKLGFDLEKSNESNFLISEAYISDEVVFSGNCFDKKRNLKILNSVFKELVQFNGNNGRSVFITNALFQKGVFLPISTYRIYSWWKFKKNREVSKQIKLIHSSIWCVLKNQSLARNDNISALEFKRYEMDSYSEELKSSEGKSQEKFVLWLNNLSNKHGLSWGRGLIFTIFVWISFYAFFYTLSHSGFDLPNVQIDIFKSKFWVDAFKFLWIPNGIDLLTDAIKFNYSFFYSLIIAFFFIFGKIFIGYGIFQTISAFRKHGKL